MTTQPFYPNATVTPLVGYPVPNRFDPLYPTPPRIAAPDCANLMRLATLGAVVGASLAASRQLRQVQSGTQTPQRALLETGKGAVAAGVATAAGGAIAASFSEQGLSRLGLLFLAGSAVLYGLSPWTDAQEL